MSGPVECMDGEEWKRKKAELTVMIEELERDAAGALAWYKAWKEDHKGFRCTWPERTTAAE